MSVVQVDGSTITGTSTNNDVGTIRHGGTISSAKWTSQPLGDHSTRQNGSEVKITNSSGAERSVAAGNFATLAEGAYIIRRVTTTLAGVTNTVLRSGASNFGHRPVVARREGSRASLVATAIRNNNWNPYNGSWDTDPTVLNENYGNDDASRPTAAIPGELVYQTGSTIPTQDDYKADDV